MLFIKLCLSRYFQNVLILEVSATVLFCALSILFCATGCARPYDCDCYIDSPPTAFQNSGIKPWTVKSFEAFDLRATLIRTGFNPMYGWVVNETQRGSFLTFLTDHRVLESYCIETAKFDTALSLEKIPGMDGAFVTLFQGDTLHVISQSDARYSRYLISHKAVTILDTFDLGHKRALKNAMISFIVGRQGMAYQFPLVFLKYGVHSERTNFIDRSAYLAFNIQTKSIEKLIPYPTCFYCSGTYLPTSTFVPNPPGGLVVVFDYIDSLYFYDHGGKLLFSKPILHPPGDTCTRVTFQRSKSHNLAYIRKYISKNEVNIFLGKTSSEFISIQRMGKANLHQKDAFQVFVFDSAGNQIYTEKLPSNLKSFVGYKNGFLGLNDSANRILYYDFTK